MPKRGPIWEKLEARRQMRPTRVVEHELILRAVAARDPDKARAATRAHLQAAIKDYLDGPVADPSDAGSEVAEETGGQAIYD
jgi:DNA-binding GntR family transcriptional regulator